MAGVSGSTCPQIARFALSIQADVTSSSTVEQIRSWARGFRSGELTVDDIQDRFAALGLAGHDLAHPLRKRIAEAQQELDAIRFGMCENGQRAEIDRIFRELETLTG